MSYQNVMRKKEQRVMIRRLQKKEIFSRALFLLVAVFVALSPLLFSEKVAFTGLVTLGEENVSAEENASAKANQSDMGKAGIIQDSTVNGVGNDVANSTINADTGMTNTTNRDVADMGGIGTAEGGNVGNRANTDNVTDNTSRINNVTDMGHSAEISVGISSGTEKAVVWNYLQADPSKIKDGGASFDGRNDYSILEETRNATIQKNHVEINAAIKIDPDTNGIIAAKWDYLNVRFIVLAVDVTGSIRFDTGDMGHSDPLETNKTFNDGKFHTVTAFLNQSVARIYVDSMLEAEGDASQLGDLNSDVPFSVGANAGYLPWMGQTLNNFNGIIKEVKILYK